jgi:chromosome partitioning protein
MRRTEIAAFLNQKGGVGKTTSVVNIGSGLTILGKNVLVIDLDPQGHLTSSIGIEPNKIKKTIYDVLRGETDARESLVEKELGARLSVNGRDSALSLAVIPSNVDMADAESMLSLLPDRDLLLKKAIEGISSDFDYILIDCPPSLGLLATNALAAANKVYIPVQAEYLALESIGNLQKKIESVIARLNPELEIGGLIATRYDGRKVLNKTVVERLKERFGALFLETMIRDNIVLAEAPRVGKDIFTYRPRSYGAEDYLNLSLEILDGAKATGARFTVERGGVIARQPGGEVSLPQ